MARRRQRTRFSLFAFQDIVTGLCGVLILLVLTMVVDLADRRAQDREHRVPEVAIEEKTAAIRKEIAELKKNLSDTDYEAIKFGEGAMTEEEYAPYKPQRAEWRARINELEESL